MKTVGFDCALKIHFPPFFSPSALLFIFTSVNAQCKGDVLTTPVRGKVPLRAEYVVEDTTVTPIEANSVRILNCVGCCVLFYVLYVACLTNSQCGVFAFILLATSYSCV